MILKEKERSSRRENYHIKKKTVSTETIFILEIVLNIFIQICREKFNFKVKV